MMGGHVMMWVGLGGGRGGCLSCGGDRCRRGRGVGLLESKRRMEEGEKEEEDWLQ